MVEQLLWWEADMAEGDYGGKQVRLSSGYGVKQMWLSSGYGGKEIWWAAVMV
jgi:hypothetical protein